VIHGQPRAAAQTAEVMQCTVGADGSRRVGVAGSNGDPPLVDRKGICFLDEEAATKFSPLLVIICIIRPAYGSTEFVVRSCHSECALSTFCSLMWMIVQTVTVYVTWNQLMDISAQWRWRRNVRSVLTAVNGMGLVAKLWFLQKEAVFLTNKLVSNCHLCK
jgi:hypothetical protein